MISLKVKNSLLKLRKVFKETKDRELKYAELKIRKKQESYFLNQLMYLQKRMDKFKEKK